MKLPPKLCCLIVTGLLIVTTFAQSTPSSPATDSNLRCEFLRTPLGIDDVKPALSWTIPDPRRGVVQTSYRVLVAASEALLAQNQGDLWDSGEITSNQSHLIIYAGKPLVSRQRCFWKVQVTTRATGETKPTVAWLEPSWWEMGLLKPADWAGSWIQSSACKPIENETTQLWTRQALIPQDLNLREVKNSPDLAQAVKAEGERLMGSILPAPMFRKSFDIPGTIKRARLYISGLGFQETYLNGAAVSNRMHDPSVNFYGGRGGYVTHDVTSLIRDGKNMLTAIVGSGWWNESIIWGSPEKVLGQPSLRAQIEVELVDGKRLIFPTDQTWTTATGPFLKNHYYAGEAYDARRAPGWKSGQDDGLAWLPATEVQPPVPVLVAQKCEPERVIRRVKPVAITEPRPGVWVYDFGQMLMGTVELNVKAPAGTSIVMRSSEWTWQPEKQGPRFQTSLLHYDNADSSKQTPGMIVGKPRGSTYFSWSFNAPGMDKQSKVHLGVPTLVYVAQGDAAGETWHPSFTTHPFRYIEVQGLKEKPTTSLLTGLVISNDEEVIGKFTSGNPLFNDIWEAAMNSTRYTTHGMTWDNAVERLQSQVYHAWSAPFASYVLWYPNLWRKVMEDMRLCSGLPLDKPTAFGTAVYGSRGKAGGPNQPVTQGVTVELPMQYYDRYGDQRELALAYPSMKAWCEAFFPNHDGKIIDKASMGAWNDHFYKEMSADGDWTPEWEQKAMMSMMLYEDIRRTADVARILKKSDDAKSLDQLAGSIREVINQTWYNAKTKTYGAAKNNSGAIDASTGWHGLMAMAIAKGVAPEGDVPQLLDNCIADMKAHYKNHAAAGHITHQLLYDVYGSHGMVETCYDMMNATGYPSYAWMLQSGNRTIPEGPTLPDQLPAKASAYQNECQEPARWFTQGLCGISPDQAEPGFKHLFLRPQIPSRLPSASLITTTPYGVLESSWEQSAGMVTWKVKIPANSSATALIPATSAGSVLESGKPLSEAAGCKIQGQKPYGLECQLGSGAYTFRFPTVKNDPSRLSELK